MEAMSGTQDSRAQIGPVVAPKAIAILVGGLGYALLALTEFLDLGARMPALAFGAMAGAVAAWQIEARWPVVGRWSVAMLLVGLVVAAYAWVGVVQALALLPLPVALAAAFISVPAAGGVACVEAALMLVVALLQRWENGAAGWLFVAAALAATVAVMAAAAQQERRLFQSLEAAQTIAEEARKRKAELEELREDWLNSSRQLALANERLSALRVLAEEARKSKAAFVAKVSHEFRTPLNIIIGMVNLMIEAPEIYAEPFPERAMEQLQIVYRNCQHLSSMIEDVLALSQVESGRMTLRREYVALEGVIDSAVTVVRPLAEQKRLSLSLSIPRDLPEVYCDRTRLRQVILNLLSNAARLTDRGEIRVGVEAQGSHVTIRVADTGPGISPEDAGRIFEPFMQGGGVDLQREGGSGLGLSISRQFVQLHGGRMWLESEVGRGTTFFVELPISEPVPHAARPDRWIRSDWMWVERSFRTERFGMADQALRPRMILCGADTGLSTDLAHFADQVEFVEVSGLEEALAQLQRGPAHALVINAASPSRLVAAVESARVRLNDTPVIGLCYPPRFEHARSAGASDYLVKPLTHGQLSDAISALGRPLRQVLIVDDEDDARQLLAYYLQAYDREIEVIAVGTGAQALDCLRRRQPDLLLVDLVMPDMDGWQVLEEKAADETIRDIPTIIVSAQDPGEGPPRGALLIGTISQGLTVGQGVTCACELAAHLMEPG